MSTKIYGETGVSQIQDEVIDNITFFNGQTVRGSIVPSFDQYLWVRDEKAAGTSGGSSTAATWHTRTLNTIKYNTIPSASLDSNLITLPSGTYYIKAVVPAYNGTRHKATLYNNTTTQHTVIGLSTYNGTATGSFCIINGTFNVSSTSDFKIYHYITTAQATNGLSVETNCGQTEVYTEVEIWKIG